MAQAKPRPWYPWYVLFVLTTLNLLLIWDKIILTTLFEPIRHEFSLTDSQLGLIGGGVYAAFMGVAGLPLGYLADRTSRRNLASCCILFWSAATAACGVAQSVPQLVVARLCVGVGEAGGAPAAISMIADLFERRRRATAMAIFMFGASLAGLVNLIVTSNVSHAYGWRAALLVASVPGIAVALLLWLTVREPIRGFSDRATTRTDAPTVRETLSFIASQRALICVLVGATLSYVTIAGMSAWFFSYIIRVHHVPLQDIAWVLGIGFVAGGLIGTLLGGWLVDQLARRDERWRAWSIAGGALASVVVGAAAVLVSEINAFIVLASAFSALSTFWFPSALALSQSLVELRMRSMVIALLYLLGNLVGYGLGPVVVGALSDLYGSSFGEQSLRYAMLTIIFVNCGAALAFFLAAHTLRADLTRANPGSSA